MSDATTLRDLIKTYRRAMGWTQEDVARRWNYSFETISAWERGKRSPSAQEIPRLANLLGISPEELAACLRMSSSTSIMRTTDSSRRQIAGRWGTAFETWGELVHIYRNRTEFNSDFSYPRMLQKSHNVLAVGISLNAIALTYSRERIIQSIVDDNASYSLCFLDPDSPNCKQREREEGLEEGTIAELTRLNIRHIQFIQRQLAHINPRHTQNLRLLAFDLPPRYNIYIADDSVMTAQTYGYGRGEDTPTLVLRRQTTNGLFEFYASAARYTLEHATPLPAPIPTPAETLRG